MAVLVLTVCTAFSFPFFKTPSNKVFGFGVAASFKDTIVYFTEIQELDSAVVEKGFLKHRPAYSAQLKTYMEGGKKLKSQTCMIYFSKDSDKLKKMHDKLRKIYHKDKSTSIQNVTLSEFHFTKPENTDDNAVTVE